MPINDERISELLSKKVADLGSATVLKRLSEETRKEVHKLVDSIFDLVEVHPDDYRGFQYLAMALMHDTVRVYAKKHGGIVDEPYWCMCPLCMASEIPKTAFERVKRAKRRSKL